MTREEAIKFLKSGCLTLACEYHVKNRCNADYREKEVKKDEALKMAIESLESKWIPCSVRLPEKNDKKSNYGRGEYIGTVVNEQRLMFTTSVIYDYINKKWVEEVASWKVIAWCEMPEPYKEGET